MKPEFYPLIDDLALAYRYRPSTGQPSALLVLMHGVGSNENALLGLANYIPAHLAVVVVRSPLTMAPGAYAAFSVNFTANGPKIDAEAAEASRQKLIQFIPALQMRYGVSPARTLIAGFSQGGIMSASLALTHPQCVRGFAILSGRILPEIEPMIAPAAALAHLAAWVAHGENDEKLPYFWAEHSTALLQKCGVSFQHAHYKMGHEITPDVAVDFVNWAERILTP